MAVIASRVYRDGIGVRDVSLDALDDLQMDEREFIWIGVANPTEEEMTRLQARFHFHPLAVEDSLKARHLPKIDMYGDHLFVIARPAQFEGDTIDYGTTAIFVGVNHIVTVRHGSPRAHTELRAKLEAAPSLLKHGVDYVLHAVLDFVVDGYLPVVQAIEDIVLAMEQRALDTFLSREEVGRLFTLRRDLTRFLRYVVPTGEVCSKLEHLETPCIDTGVRPYFKDVLDHVNHVRARIEGLREIVGSVFEVSTLMESQRQGAITRQLAAWAAILAVPTAIAGIYGMNFEHMPELKWEYGYYVVLALIAGFCGVLYVRFKRAKWL